MDEPKPSLRAEGEAIPRPLATDRFHGIDLGGLIAADPNVIRNRSAIDGHAF
jgi:hypothetical protein